MDSAGIYGHEKTADRTVCRFLCPKIIKGSFGVVPKLPC